MNWFNAYLTNRTQSVIINGIQSDAEPILYGVPQGSVLGPLLFIMYINDLPSVTKYCKVHLYADDTLLFFESSSVQAIKAALILNHFEDQSYAYGNPPKAEFSSVIHS